MSNIDYKAISEYWSKKWQGDGIYRTDVHSDKKKLFLLVEFPYPSGDGLHVGHVRSYTAMDVIARKKRREGYEVLFPMGYDSFGLPAENYAIKTGIHPSITTRKNIDNFTRQMKDCGFSFDWERVFETTDPQYYKWTQWIFLKLYEKGLAYKKEMPVNWCPKDKCVLANEEVLDGKCERCGTQAEKRNKEQWMLAITKYAERLDKDLDETAYLEKIKIQQRNWIGLSEGSEIDFKIKGGVFESSFTIFTTRADTIFGCTYCVLAPEHPLVTELLKNNILANNAEVSEYKEQARLKTDIDRSAEGKEKTGVKLEGVMAINPANNEEVPVFIADYVLPQYGTGAIMAVPAHDERDYEFAKKYSLPINEVIASSFGKKLSDAKDVEGVVVVVYNKTKDKYLKLVNTTSNEAWLVGGGREENETFDEAALRELAEEAGYAKAESMTPLGGPILSYYYNNLKQSNRKSIGYSYLATVTDAGYSGTKHEAHEHYDIEWVSLDELIDSIRKTKGGVDHWLEILNRVKKNVTSPVSSEEGIVINSGDFNGLTSQEARRKITDTLAGKIVTKSKLRDWVFARQRYWGEPIPVVYDKDGKMYPVAESELPIVLPMVDKYEPTDNGESPLSQVTDWVNIQGYLTEKGEFKSLPNLDAYTFNKNEPLDINTGPHNDLYRGGVPIIERNNVVCIIKHPTEEKYLVSKWKKIAWNGFLTGGIESGETEKETVFKEIKEETGYVNIKDVQVTDFSSHGLFYHVGKNVNRLAHYKVCVAQLADLEEVERSDEEKEIADFVWVEKEKVADLLTRFDMKSVWEYYTLGKVESKNDVKVIQVRRETDTMPQWAGSSWYFMRYIDPKNDNALGDKELLAKWLPVDWYNGGMEHTTLHLLYSRFWYKFLYDIGVVPTSEPYYKRTSQGMILGAGGVKMSKSLGNVVNPDKIIDEYGPDVLRVYEMFIGPFDQSVAWDDKAIVGVSRFLEKVEKCTKKVTDNGSSLSIVHQTVEKVTKDIDQMAFNTAVSQLMICVNEFEKRDTILKTDFEMFLQLLAPFAPFASEELWKNLGNSTSIHTSVWPNVDQALLIDPDVTYAIQITGKLRGTVVLPRDLTESEVFSTLKNHEIYTKYVGEVIPKKIIFVPNRLVNIVI
jgi:leucyl-tRNA synthetase